MRFKRYRLYECIIDAYAILGTNQRPDSRCRRRNQIKARQLLSRGTAHYIESGGELINGLP